MTELFFEQVAHGGSALQAAPNDGAVHHHGTARERVRKEVAEEGKKKGRRPEGAGLKV